MLYQQLITHLEDFAEPAPLVQGDASSHSLWIFPPAIVPTGQWLENAILLNPYLHQLGDVKQALQLLARKEKPSEKPSGFQAAETENRMAS